VDAKSGLRYKFIEYIPGRTVVTPTAAAAAAAVVPNEEPEVNPEEMQYLDVCMLDILANDVRRGDRAGTGTLSKFGVQMRYSLRDDTLPLLMTKRTFWRGSLTLCYYNAMILHY
jgi:dihydrofolate reductase/thymidylate synthase